VKEDYMFSVAPHGDTDIYLRESKDDLAKGYSPQEMLKQCRARAAELGLVVDREIIEQAKRDEYDPPKLMETLDRARRGEIRYLLSWDMFRLTGEAGKHHWFKEQMARTACAILYATVEFPDTDEGRLQEGVVGLIGGYERAKTRTRTQNGIRGKLADGTPVCNARTPYGLVKVYEHRRGKKRPVGYARCPERMPVLERIIRAVPTMPLVDLCDVLNAEGVPAPDGGRWAPGSIHALLRNQLYAGAYRFGATKQRRIGRGPNGNMRYSKERRDPSEVSTLDLGAFVDLADLAAARAALESRKRVRRARRPDVDDPFSLRGIATCGHCGGALSCTVNNGYRRYTCLRAYPTKSQRADPSFERCAGPLPQIHADDLEAHVWGRVAERLADRDALEAALIRAADGGEAKRRHDEQVASITTKIARLAMRIRNGADQLRDFERGSDTYRLLLAGQRNDEAQKAELEANLTGLRSHAPAVLTADAADGLRALWGRFGRGLAEAASDPAKQRAAYRVITLTVVVTLDAGGVRLGRDHAYGVALDGHLGLSDGDKLAHGRLILWDSHSDGLSVALAAA
jgi:DNA invertase Pin-like site-specific DNA recombinase